MHGAPPTPSWGAVPPRLRRLCRGNGIFFGLGEAPTAGNAVFRQNSLTTSLFLVKYVNPSQLVR